MPKITENTKNHQECQRSPIRLKITKYYHQLEILPKMQNNQKCRNWPNLKNITKNAKEPTISSNNSHQDLLSPENNRGECIHTSSLSQGQVFLCLHLHWCASQQLQSSPRLTPPWTEYIQNSSLKSSQGLPLSSSLLLCLPPSKMSSTILPETSRGEYSPSSSRPHPLCLAKAHLQLLMPYLLKSTLCTCTDFSMPDLWNRCKSSHVTMQILQPKAFFCTISLYVSIKLTICIAIALY